MRRQSNFDSVLQHFYRNTPKNFASLLLSGWMDRTVQHVTTWSEMIAIQNSSMIRLHDSRLEPAIRNDAELASLMQEPGKESAGTLASGAADEPTEGPVPEVVQEPIQRVAEEPTEERVQEFVWESTPLLGVPEEVADVPTSADDSALTRYNTVAEDVVHHSPSSGDDGITNKEQHAADNSVTPADTPALQEDANVDYQNMCMQSIEEFLMWPPTEEVPPSPSSGNTTEKAETPEQYREEQVSADAAVGEGTQTKIDPPNRKSPTSYPKDPARSACPSSFQSLLVFRGSSNDMAVVDDARR